MTKNLLWVFSLVFINPNLCFADNRSEIDCYQSVLKYASHANMKSGDSVVIQAPDSTTTWWMTPDGLYSTRAALSDFVKKGGTFAAAFQFDPDYLRKNPDMKGKMSKLILEPGTGVVHSNPKDAFTASSEVVFQKASAADRDQFLKNFAQALKPRFDSIRDPNDQLWAAEACQKVPNLGNYIPKVAQAIKDSEAEQSSNGSDSSLDSIWGASR